MKYDATLKELFQNLPEKLLEILIGKEVKAAELLPVEFPSVSAKRADLLLRLKDGKIHHLELQTGDDDKMPWRMLEYFYLIYRQYKEEPHQIVLYLGNKTSNIVSSIELSRLEFSYILIDIKEIDASLLLESEKLSDNILAILCKVNNVRETIRYILSKIIILSGQDRTTALTQLLILAGLRTWKVIALEEVKLMPLTFSIEENEFLLDVFQQGEQKGFQKGRQEGRQEELQEVVKQLLEKKFGVLPKEAISKIELADLETLQQWVLRIFDANLLDDFFQQ